MTSEIQNASSGPPNKAHEAYPRAPENDPADTAQACPRESRGIGGHVLVEPPEFRPADEQRVAAAVAALTELFAEWLRNNHQRPRDDNR